MSILSPTNLETADYGTVGWNAIYSSNFQKLNDYLAKFEDLWNDTAADWNLLRYDSSISKWVKVVIEDISKHLRKSIVSITANYTVDNNNEVILADATSAAITITLPDPSTNSGKELIIQKIDSTINTVTLQPSTGNIEGSTSISLSRQYETIILCSDGNEYKIISKRDNFALFDLSNVDDSTILNKIKNVDGSGSGLDADTVDGYETSTTSAANSIPISDSNGYLNSWINQGSGSGLDADLLDGKESTAFEEHITVTNITADYTSSTNNEVILADATSATITITLTTASNIKVSVKKIDSSTNTVTIQASSGNIDGQTSITLSNQYESKTLVCDGSNWWII